MFLKTETLNNVMNGSASTKLKVGTLVLKGRQQLQELLDSLDGEEQIYLDVYTATDQKTDKVRHSENGEIILNVKRSKKRCGAPPLINDPDHSFKQAWQE
jgi:hypothetical protein